MSEINNLKAGHKLLKEYNYTPGEINRGYNNRILYINLSDKTIKEKPVTPLMKEKFIFDLNRIMEDVFEAT